MRASRLSHTSALAVAIMISSALHAGAQAWRPGVFNGQPATFPVDTVLEGADRYREALPSSIRALPIPRTIAAAEAEGAAFPWRPATDPARAAKLGRATGDAERRCVVVAGREATVRAGDFVVGGSVGQMSSGKNVFWSPLHDPAIEGQGLLVRFARIDSGATPADTVRMWEVKYHGAFTVELRDRLSPFDARPLADVGARAAEPFFTRGIDVIGPGKWLAVATSGTDWGCVVLDVAR